MKNKITLQITLPKDSEKHLLNRRDFASFLIEAEKDYILTRILIWVGMEDQALYHYQQAMEKYLKAYLVQKKQLFKDTHDLHKLALHAGKFDSFFRDQEFLDACRNVTYFEEVGRYPQEKVRSFGWLLPDVIYFLDEFIFEMTERVSRNGIRNVFEEIKKGNIGLGSNYFVDTSLLIDLFYRDNQYFQKSD